MLLQAGAAALGDWPRRSQLFIGSRGQLDQRTAQAAIPLCSGRGIRWALVVQSAIPRTFQRSVHPSPATAGPPNCRKVKFGEVQVTYHLTSDTSGRCAAVVSQFVTWWSNCWYLGLWDCPAAIWLWTSPSSWCSTLALSGCHLHYVLWHLHILGPCHLGYCHILLLVHYVQLASGAPGPPIPCHLLQQPNFCSLLSPAGRHLLSQQW